MTESKPRGEYNPDLKALVNKLIELRHGHMLNQKELAAKMGVQQSVISRIEQFHHHPKIETLQAYAKALDCKIVFMVFADV